MDLDLFLIRRLTGFLTVGWTKKRKLIYMLAGNILFLDAKPTKEGDDRL